MKLYSDLTDWYSLIEPRADREDEATVYGDALRAALPSAKTLLELGAGAGNNAWYLRQRETWRAQLLRAGSRRSSC